MAPKQVFSLIFFFPRLNVFTRNPIITHVGDVDAVDTENKLHQPDMEDIPPPAGPDTVWRGRLGILTQGPLQGPGHDLEVTVETGTMVTGTTEATAVSGQAEVTEATAGAGPAPAARTTRGRKTPPRLTPTPWRPWTGRAASTTLVNLIRGK